MNYTCPHCSPVRVGLVRTFTPAGERVYTCPRCRWTCAARVAASAAVRRMHVVRTRRTFCAANAYPDRWADIAAGHAAWPDELFSHRTLLLQSVAGHMPSA